MDGRVCLMTARRGYPVSMRVGLTRHDPTIGDLQRNAETIASAIAAAGDVDVLVFPELAICGYPPRDLLLRSGFVDACRQAVESLAADVPDNLLVLVGTPWPMDGNIANAVVALRGGRVEALSAKRLLPAYDVFDEDRYFTPGDGPCIIEHAGRRVGVLVCEDCWQGGDVDAGPYPHDPVAHAIEAGADVLVVASASPFILGKHERQRARLAEVAKAHGVHVCAVNQAGANDDLIFDGDAMACGPDGGLLALREPFDQSACLNVDLNAVSNVTVPQRDIHARRIHALCEAIAGYIGKTQSNGVLLGISGGIDSAVVAALAVASLGPQQVHGITMPARYTSDETRADAHTLAEGLGIELETIEIEALHAACREALGDTVHDGDLADQNVQARLRGLLLMARSNATQGSLVLSCGNKSEIAVGYATLYGDMNGALCPLGDVLKTDVYAMASWMNTQHADLGFTAPPIPESIIDRPPTAELRPDQCDQDSLPPYDVLDAIVRGIVEAEQNDATVSAAAGVDAAMVAQWRRTIDRAQFKRSQASVIPKLTARAFGRGRPWPIVSNPTGAPVPERST